MPFQADNRCGLMKVELNVSKICEELEQLVEKNYTDDIDEGSKFWYYVLILEDKYSVVADKGVEFWEWFQDNYNNIYEWNDIEEYFEEEDDESEDEETKMLRMLGGEEKELELVKEEKIEQLKKGYSWVEKNELYYYN